MLDLSVRRVMIDLETLSTESNAAILSIGAVVFGNGLHPDFSHSFYDKVHPTSAESYGHASRESLQWWDKQDQATRAEAFSGTLPLESVLGNFTNWMKTNLGDLDNIELWSNGADFDLVVLRSAYYAIGESYPFNFRMHRCYRTLKSMMPPRLLQLAEQSVNTAWVKHNALSDAKSQAVIANVALSNVSFTGAM